MGDFFSGLSLGDQLELGTASLSSGVDPETWNMMLRQEMDAQALAKQVQKHGLGHGRDAVTQAVAPGTTPPEGSTGGQVTSNTSHARYEVLLPNPDKVPKKDATKEPTYRLRKAMKLV